MSAGAYMTPDDACECLLPFRVLSRCLDPACLPLPQSRSSDPCAHHLTHLPTLPPHLHTVSLLGNTLLYDDTTISRSMKNFFETPLGVTPVSSSNMTP